MSVALGVLLLAVSTPPPLTLEDAIALAEEQARDVVRARLDVLIVDAQRARAVGAVLPRVDLTVGAGGGQFYNRIIEVPLYTDCVSSLAPGACTEADYLPPRIGFDQNVSADGWRDQYVIEDLFLGNFNATLSARQLIYDGGRWWTEIGRFDELERLRRATLREVLGNVRLNVVRQFYGFERARQSLERFERRREAGEKQLERALAEGRDVASAQRNLAEDRLAYARAKFAASRSRRSLNLALARHAATPVEIVLPEHLSTTSTTVPKFKLPSRDEAFDLAMAHRGALEVQRANVEQLRMFVDVRRAELFPNVSVGGRLSRRSRRADRAYLDPYNINLFAGFDVTMRWNLYRGGIDDNLIQEAQLNVKKAIEDLRNAERNVLSEVEDRLENLSIQLQIFELAVDSLRPATIAVEKQRAAYEAGKIQLVSLRDAELRYTDSEVRAINARLDLEIARELLRRAIGRDVVDIESP